MVDIWQKTSDLIKADREQLRLFAQFGDDGGYILPPYWAKSPRSHGDVDLGVGVEAFGFDAADPASLAKQFHFADVDFPVVSLTSYRKKGLLTYRFPVDAEVSQNG